MLELVQQGWHIIEPGGEYQHGRHIEAICLHLEAVTRGQIRQLLINVPPRFAKSLIVSVFWPVWSWLNQPETRWMFASYAHKLAVRDSLKCRRILESPWFKSRWGESFQLRTDQNTKDKFENDKTGYRLATSVEGSSTGEGADILVCDDPHNVMEAFSDRAMETAINWFDEAWSTRLNDQKTGRKVVIMQRVSEKDVSGHLLKKGGWEHLCLPMEFEPERKCKTSIGWEDWRTEPGELLWPERIGKEELANLKKSLGSYAVAGQLQQSPAPRGGGMFKREWFKVVAVAPASTNKVRAWDRGATHEGGDYSVGLLMSKSPENQYFIEHVIRLQGTPFVVDKTIRSIASQDGYEVAIKLPQDPGQAGVKDVALMIRDLAGYKVSKEVISKNKETMANACVSQAEAGNIFIVAGPWNQPFLNEIETFPRGEKDDQIDTMSLAFHHLAGGRLVFA